MQDKRVAIFIPAFNAASTIVKVLDRIPQNIRGQVTEIFVIDNDSTDDTSMVAIDYREKHGLHNLEVIRNPKNMGYGGSQKIAYKRCIEKGYDCVAMLHGDAQYAPELLETLIQPVLEGKADFVFGSRMSGDPLKGGMPIIRFLGNRVLTALQNFFLGTRLSEFHSGYRVFSVKALQNIPFEKFSSDYHFDTEMIILFVDRGFRIIEMPIPTYYGDEENYVNIWDYGMKVLISTATYFFHRRGMRKSTNWGRILTSALPLLLAGLLLPVNVQAAAKIVRGTLLKIKKDESKTEPCEICAFTLSCAVPGSANKPVRTRVETDQKGKFALAVDPDEICDAQPDEGYRVVAKTGAGLLPGKPRLLPFPEK